MQKLCNMDMDKMLKDLEGEIFNVPEYGEPNHWVTADEYLSCLLYTSGSEYKYKVVNQYDIEKTGTANIVRNAEKSTLTLITCRHNTNKQIIYICELVEKV